MRSFVRLATIGLILGICAGFAFAGGQSEGAEEAAAPEAGAEMRFFHDNPEWQENFEAVAAAFEEETGYILDPTEFDTQVYKSRVKVDLTNPRAPGGYKWWFGFRARELTDAGLAADLSDVWDETGEYFAEGVREGLTQNDIAYGFPLHVSYWVWYYSKPVYEEYGLELPTTWDEFMDQLQFFADEGVYGIGNTIGDSRWTSFIVFQELLYRIDAEFYNDLMAGEASWTDDQAVRAMEIWKEMLDSGFFAPMDAKYVDDFPRMMKDGELAFAPFGDWYGGILQSQGLISGDDYGVFIPPAIEPEGGESIVFEISPLMASANSDELPVAKAFFRWWASSETAAEIRWERFRFAPTNHLPLSQIEEDDPARAEEFRLVEDYPNKLIRFWEATPVPIVEYAVDQFNTMLVEPESYMEILENIEAEAQAVWAEQE